MDKKLHIVSFDIPAPPDYGGVIDVYYRAKALKKAGIYVILHCFAYGRDKNLDLSEIADEVYYYDRAKRWIDQLSPLPFIVKSRMNERLNKRLLRDQHPILMEGHHCSALLLDRRFKDRKLFVRIHNIESNYYEELAKVEQNKIKRLYFRFESSKLKRYDRFLPKATALFCLSEQDSAYYKKMHPEVHLWNIGLNVGEAPKNVEQKRMALFQGNLSVAENQQAALQLVQLWRKEKFDFPLLIAGKNPPAAWNKLLADLKSVQLIPNPGEEDLFDLIESAQFNITISENTNGTKIKLLHNLLHGNRNLVNQKLAESSTLESDLEIFSDEKELINLLVSTNYLSYLERQNRYNRLLDYYHPDKAAAKIIPVIFPE